MKFNKNKKIFSAYVLFIFILLSSTILFSSQSAVGGTSATIIVNIQVINDDGGTAVPTIPTDQISADLVIENIDFINYITGCNLTLENPIGNPLDVEPLSSLTCKLTGDVGQILQSATIADTDFDAGTPYLITFVTPTEISLVYGVIVVAEADRYILTLVPGAYSVVEPALLGYSQSLSADCSGTIAAGETKTCIITYDDNDTTPPNVLSKKITGPNTVTIGYDESVTATDALNDYSDLLITGELTPRSITAVNQVLPDTHVITFGGAPVGTDAIGTIDINNGGETVEDTEGNPLSTQNDLPLTDGQAPTMDSAITTTTETIDVTFSENLDGTTVSASDFTIGGVLVVSATESVAGIVTLTAADEFGTGDTPDVELLAGSVDDVAGNTLVNAGPITPADGVSPVVVSVVPSPDPIAEANVGIGTFALTIVYSEGMITSGAANPVVAYSNTDVTVAPITLDNEVGSWGISTDTYTSTWDVLDNNVEDKPDVGVTGAKDLAGNAQTAFSQADLFEVDTVKPTGSVTIDNGAAATTDANRAVVIDISCTDAGSGCDMFRVAENGILTVQPFESWTGPVNDRPATVTPERGTKTMTVEFKDTVGNISDPDAEDTIALDAIFRTLVVNPSASDATGEWEDFVFILDGTVDHALPTDKVELNFDYNVVNFSPTFDFPAGYTFPNSDGKQIDSSLTLDNPDTYSFSASSEYPRPSRDTTDTALHTHNPIVRLLNNGGFVVTETVQIGPNTEVDFESTNNAVIKEHETSVLLDLISYPYTNDAFTASGDLIDDLTLAGIGGKTVTFSGSGATGATVTTPLSPTTTSGFTVTDSSGIVIDDNGFGDNVLRLNMGGKISFPSNPSYVILTFTDMTVQTFDVLVTPSVGDPFTAIGESIALNNGILTLTDPEGISSIEIGEFSDVGPAGITRVETQTNNIISIIDEEFAAPTVGTPTSLSFSQGSFFDVAIASSIPINDLNVKGIFDGSSDPDYETSSNEPLHTDEQIYSVNYASAGGFGGANGEVPDAGVGIVNISCAAGNDDDGDALCDDWEGPSGAGVPMPGGGFYPLAGSHKDKKDIYVEVDYMPFHNPFVAGASNDGIDDVIAKFASAPVTNVGGQTNGIVLHVEQGESILPVEDTLLGVWAEFNTYKAANFGCTANANCAIPTETAAQKAAKAQAFHYVIFAHSVGGASGVAELKSNDFIVSLGQGFGQDPAVPEADHPGSEGTRDEIAGTFMHELGHNLNLNHGGPAVAGNADNGINCKPNHDSIMTYSRQLPNLLGANWRLDYSDGGLGPLAGLRESGGAGGNIAENNLNTLPPAFSGNLVHAGAFQPYIIWGTPGAGLPQTYLVQQSRATATAPAIPGGDIDWNGDGTIQTSPSANQARDINAFGFSGCESGLALSTTHFKNYNEWTALNYNFRGSPGGQFDGLCLLDPQHCVETPHPNDADDTVNAQARVLSAIHQGVSPWNNESFMTVKLGSPVNVKVSLFDGAGLPIVAGDTIVTYKVYKSGLPGVLESGTLTYEPGKSPPHWHAQFTPKNPPFTKGTTYFIEIHLDKLGAFTPPDPPTKITIDPDTDVDLITPGKQPYRNNINAPPTLGLEDPIMSMKLQISTK